MYRSSSNGTELIVEVSGEVLGLALDWVTNNLYYTHDNQTEGFITVCSMDSGQCRVILSQPDWKPMSIIVHPLKGFVSTQCSHF